MALFLLRVTVAACWVFTSKARPWEDVKMSVASDPRNIRALAMFAHALGYGWCGGNTAGNTLVGREFDVRQGDGGTYVLQARYDRNACDGYRCQDRLKITLSDFSTSFDAAKFRFKTPMVRNFQPAALGSITLRNEGDEPATVTAQYSVAKTISTEHSESTSFEANTEFGIAIRNSFEVGIPGFGTSKTEVETSFKFGFKAGKSWTRGQREEKTETVALSCDSAVPGKMQRVVRLLALKTESDVDYSVPAVVNFAVTFEGFMRYSGNAWPSHPTKRPTVAYKFGNAAVSAAEDILDKYTHRHQAWDWAWLEANFRGVLTETMTFCRTPITETINGRFTNVAGTDVVAKVGDAEPLVQMPPAAIAPGAPVTPVVANVQVLRVMMSRVAWKSWTVSAAACPASFAINWVSAQENILFHLTPRFANNVLVMNTFSSGRWGTEELVPAGVAGIVQGQALSLTVNVRDDGYHVLSGGKDIYLYRHRLAWANFKRITTSEGVVVNEILPTLPSRSPSSSATPSPASTSALPSSSPSPSPGLLPASWRSWSINALACPASFAINWAGTGKNILFRFRLDNNVLVMNSYRSWFLGLLGSWGKQETISAASAGIVQGQPLSLTVDVRDDGYHVLSGKKEIYLYRHRLAWTTFQRTTADGVVVNEILPNRPQAAKVLSTKVFTAEVVDDEDIQMVDDADVNEPEVPPASPVPSPSHSSVSLRPARPQATKLITTEVVDDEDIRMVDDADVNEPEVPPASPETSPSHTSVSLRHERRELMSSSHGTVGAEMPRQSLFMLLGLLSVAIALTLMTSWLRDEDKQEAQEAQEADVEVGVFVLELHDSRNGLSQDPMS